MRGWHVGLLIVGLIGAVAAVWYFLLGGAQWLAGAMGGAVTTKGMDAQGRPIQVPVVPKPPPANITLADYVQSHTAKPGWEGATLHLNANGNRGDSMYVLFDLAKIGKGIIVHLDNKGGAQMGSGPGESDHLIDANHASTRGQGGIWAQGDDDVYLTLKGVV